MLDVSENGIKFRNLGGKTSQDARSMYAEGLGQMFRSPDEEVRKFAGHLMRYAFFEHGFNFGHSNFGTLYPTEIAVAADGYRESLHKGNERVLSNDVDFLNTYLEQFLLNHHKLIRFFKTGNFNVNKNYGKNTIAINYDDDNDQKLLFIPDPLNNDAQIPRPLIRMPLDRNGHNETYVLHYTGENNKRQLVYEIIDYNKTDIPFYDNGDGETYDGTSPYEIKWADVKPRGRVIGLDKLKSKESDAPAKKAEAKPQETTVSTSNTTEDNDPVSKIEGITINIGQGGTLNLFTSQTVDTRKTTEPAESRRAEPTEPEDNTNNNKNLNAPTEDRKDLIENDKRFYDPGEDQYAKDWEGLNEVKETEDPNEKACY